MKINKLLPDIYEIEDFVSEDEQFYVINQIESLDQKYWEPLNKEHYEFDFWYGKVLDPMGQGLDNFVYDGIYKRCRGIFDSVLDLTGINVARYTKYDALGEHRDYWKYDEDYHIRYGLVIYWNDDYEGGEIQYRELGLTHKPKARSLLIHGGNILHGTLPVKSDNFRYVSTLFVKGSKDKPAVLSKELFDGIEESDGTIYR
jgi:hypothetical protein